MSDFPPDTRLDGPVHRFFGLSYSNYLVLHRTLMQSMPVDWQLRMVACLEDLDAAFRHVDKPTSYQVRPVRECDYSDLTEADMKQLGITRDDEDPDVYYDTDGNEHAPDDRELVPCGDDPIPHYNRGRTFVAPQTAEATR